MAGSATPLLNRVAAAAGQGWLWRTGAVLGAYNPYLLNSVEADGFNSQNAVTVGMATGAFGSHGLRNRPGISADSIRAWETASHYTVNYMPTARTRTTGNLTIIAPRYTTVWAYYSFRFTRDSQRIGSQGLRSLREDWCSLGRFMRLCSVVKSAFVAVVGGLPLYLHFTAQVQVARTSDAARRDSDDARVRSISLLSMGILSEHSSCPQLSVACVLGGRGNIL